MRQILGIRASAIEAIILELTPMEALIVTDALNRYKNDPRVNDRDREYMRDMLTNMEQVKKFLRNG